MKIISVFALAIALSGCAVYTPTKPKFPQPAAELTKPCPDLKLIEGDQVAITDLLKTVVENYNMYHQCSLKNEGWNQWYKEQKAIYDKTK